MNPKHGTPQEQGVRTAKSPAGSTTQALLTEREKGREGEKRGRKVGGILEISGNEGEKEEVRICGDGYDQCIHV